MSACFCTHLLIDCVGCGSSHVAHWKHEPTPIPPDPFATLESRPCTAMPLCGELNISASCSPAASGLEYSPLYTFVFFFYLAWMSRIPPEFMLMFTDGWVHYSQHNLVSLKLEGEQDGRDGTHVTVVTAETGLQVRSRSSSVEISKRMSLEQLLPTWVNSFI